MEKSEAGLRPYLRRSRSETAVSLVKAPAATCNFFREVIAEVRFEYAQANTSCARPGPQIILLPNQRL